MIFLKKFFSIFLTAAILSGFTVGCNSKVNSTSSQSKKSSESSANAEDTETVTEPTEPKVRNIQTAEGTYIYDYAKVLSDDEFKSCNDYAGWIYKEYLINAAVVTTNTLDGLSAEEYAEQAYSQIYEGKGSGLLILINNDTNNDIIYKKGSCLNYINESNQNDALFTATKKIVEENNYGAAVSELLKLAESCPMYIFDNSNVFTAEQLTQLEELCGGSNISILATSNGTDISNEELGRQYFDRHYSADEKSDKVMIVLDVLSNTFTIISDKNVSISNDVIKSAESSAEKHDYQTGVTDLINALK